MAGNDYPIPPLPQNPTEAVGLLEAASTDISEAYVKLAQVHIYLAQLHIFYENTGFNEQASPAVAQATQMSEDLNDPTLKLMSDIRDIILVLSNM